MSNSKRQEITTDKSTKIDERVGVSDDGFAIVAQDDATIEFLSDEALEASFGFATGALEASGNIIAGERALVDNALGIVERRAQSEASNFLRLLVLAGVGVVAIVYGPKLLRELKG